MDSSTKTLTASYTGPSLSSAGDFVLIEQQKWDKKVNTLTKLGVFGYLNSLLYGGVDISENCSDSSGYQVYAYPSRPDLNYFIGCSQGVLGPCRIENLVFSEIINCDLKTELTPHYPVQEIVGKPAWIGDPLGPVGDVITLDDPVVTDAKTLTISEPAYGSILVTYTVVRHSRTLSISPLAGALENALQCWIYALWSGGRTTMEYKFPDGSDLLNDAGAFGICQNSSTGDTENITINEPNVIKCVHPSDETEYVDYCDQKI